MHLGAFGRVRTLPEIFGFFGFFERLGSFLDVFDLGSLLLMAFYVSGSLLLRELTTQNVR